MVLEQYEGIDYSRIKKRALGSGLLLDLSRPKLSDRIEEIYERSRPYQDKRDDAGHAESATWFANVLSDMVGLEDDQRDIACLAAIMHDTGYALIEDIRAKFTKMSQLFESLDSRHKEQARFLWIREVVKRTKNMELG